jgi:sortase A
MKIMIHWSSSRKHRVCRYTQNAFAVLGCVALSFCAFAYFHAEVFQAYERGRFDKTFYSRAQGLNELTRTAPPPSLRQLVREGSPLGRVEIPRLALSVIVAEGIRPSTLRLAAGHIPGTAFPDESGNVGIAAHRDTFFRKLRDIQQGDIIIVRTLAGSSEYSVEETRVVKPKDVEVLDSSSQPVLTLITCYPFHYVGPAPERFIVRARRISQSRQTGS